MLLTKKDFAPDNEKILENEFNNLELMFKNIKRFYVLENHHMQMIRYQTKLK